QGNHFGTSGRLVALGRRSGGLHGGLGHAAAAAAELAVRLDSQEAPYLLKLLVVQVGLDPVGATVESSLHVASQKLVAFDLQARAALLVQRLGESAKPKCHL